VEVAFARKTLSSPNSSLRLALILESIPALTLAISDTNHLHFYLAYQIGQTFWYTTVIILALQFIQFIKCYLATLNAPYHA